MKSDGRRKFRVGETLKSHLIAALRSDMADARLSDVVVTSVELPDDLSVAFINVRLLQTNTDPVAAEAAVRALTRAAPLLRRLLGPRLGLRRLPELRFRYDAGQDARSRVEAILDEIKAERDEGREE